MCQRTYIAIVLDRSGSMAISREATISGFNDQVTTIRKDSQGMETYVSFYTFNRFVELKYKCLSVNFLEDLTPKDYECKGDTAMLDAVGQAITDLKNETDSDNPNNSYLVVVVSDGMERCSKKFTQRSLAKLIKECQDTERWTFSYLGANQDLSKVAAELNIAKGSVANYTADSLGSTVAWASTNKCMSNYLKCRSKGITALKNFHSNDEEISDYSKLDMNSIPDNFDYKSVLLEKAEPGQKVDLDALLKLKRTESLRTKALWRNTN